MPVMNGRTSKISSDGRRSSTPRRRCGLARLQRKTIGTIGSAISEAIRILGVTPLREAKIAAPIPTSARMIVAPPGYATRSAPAT